VRSLGSLPCENRRWIFREERRVLPPGCFDESIVFRKGGFTVDVYKDKQTFGSAERRHNKNDGEAMRIVYVLKLGWEAIKRRL
jgi:hypothetical protein